MEPIAVGIVVLAAVVLAAALVVSHMVSAIIACPTFNFSMRPSRTRHHPKCVVEIRHRPRDSKPRWAVEMIDDLDRPRIVIARDTAYLPH